MAVLADDAVDVDRGAGLGGWQRRGPAALLPTKPCTPTWRSRCPSPFVDPIWPLSACLALGPLGPIGHLALLTGLCAAEASVRVAAADVWTQAALTGRLDPSRAADALVRGVTGEAFKLTRLADGLRHASRRPASALMTARAVFASADHLIPAKRPGLHLLLELAAEIGATLLLPQPPESIIAVAAEKGSTKLAVAARRLVVR